ncbi:MAG: tRNA (guanosine(46)-N7)-methyltransferase TrmB [Gammaproteobacteria bacterium]|nr:tRNA (guanosine(46)-N7)-methyltransferase TrmB [Gammaproteobacteria bacterium]
MTADSDKPQRKIRSFVRREGRLTPGQQQALDTWLPKYALPAEGMLDFEQVFGRCAPVTLEIGFGNGDTLFELVQRHPERDYIGIEVHRPGVGRLLKHCGEAGLDNLRVSDEDAVEILRHRVRDGSLDRVLLYFPDPWPKKRHHKRRIVQPPFAELVASKLAQGGEFHMATDWQPYAEHMLEVMSAAEAFVNTADDYAPRPEQRPLTKFEQRGQKLGHGTWDLIFRKR